MCIIYYLHILPKLLFTCILLLIYPYKHHHTIDLLIIRFSSSHLFKTYFSISSILISRLLTFSLSGSLKNSLHATNISFSSDSFESFGISIKLLLVIDLTSNLEYLSSINCFSKSVPLISTLVILFIGFNIAFKKEINILGCYGDQNIFLNTKSTFGSSNPFTFPPRCLYYLSYILLFYFYKYFSKEKASTYYVLTFSYFYITFRVHPSQFQVLIKIYTP